MSQLSNVLSRLLDLRPHEVELLGARPGVTPLAWLLLGAGVLALAGASLACWPAWQQRAALSSEALVLDQRLAGLGMAPSQGGPGAGKTAANPAAAAALAEAGTLREEIHRPWHELFEQIEAADTAESGAVHILQFSVEPPFTTLQLVVEGRDLGELVRFSQRLAGATPISSMTLTHHEGREALGAHVITATLQGRLVVPAADASGGAP